MASLKKIIYIIGENTNSDDTKYMSMKDISTYFDDECSDSLVILNRISSQINHHMNLFSVKRVGGRNFWRLNKNGKSYYEKIKDAYDPITDTLLFIPAKIEVL